MYAHFNRGSSLLPPVVQLSHDIVQQLLVCRFTSGSKKLFFGGVNRPELSDVVSADLVMCFLLLISTPLFISSNCCWRRRESTKPVYSQLAFSEFAITVKRFNFTNRRSWTNTIKVDVLRLL